MAGHILALWLALSSGAAQAQVNVERYRLDPGDDGLTGGIGISTAWKSGNVDFLEAGLSVQGAARTGPHVFLLVASGKYAAKRTGEDRAEDPGGGLLDPAARFANQGLVALRYNRDLAPRWTAELFTQAEYNEFLRLDLRSLGGVGARLAVVRREGAGAWLGTGWMLEYERTDPEEVAEDPVTLAHRWTSYASFSLAPADGVTLTSTTYAQPRLTDPRDFRILDETELSVDLSDRLSLGVAFTLRYDSEPPRLAADAPPLVPLDTELVNKIRLDF